MYEMLEHPEVTCALRTGYPSWMQDREEQEPDEDSLYEESREDDYGWE